MGNMYEVVPEREQEPTGTDDELEIKKAVSYDIPDDSRAILVAREADEVQAVQVLQRISEMPSQDNAGREMNGINEFLLATEALNTQLDREVTERFGEGFYDKVRTRINTLAEAFFKKGDDAVNWVEAKGIPLPKSKAGMRVLSGVIGVAGIAPGMGVLWPLAYVLWKRGGSIGDAINSNVGSTIKYA